MCPELLQKMMMGMESPSDMEALRLSCKVISNTIGCLNYPQVQAEWLVHWHGAQKAMGQSLLSCRQPQRVIESLIKNYGANVNSSECVAIGEYQLEVLPLACLGFHPASLEVVELLVSSPGLDINRAWTDPLRNHSRRRILEWTCDDTAAFMMRRALPMAHDRQRVPTVDFVRTILRHPGIDVNAPCPNGALGSAIFTACSADEIAALSLLLQHDQIDINVRGNQLYI